MSLPQRIAITGASGLIGSALVGHLKSEGHTVQRLVRRPVIAPDEIQWDPQTGYVDIEALRGVDAVIHLAGVGVGDKRWSKKYKSEILNSRLLGTTAIAKAVAEVKPQVFISASAIGWYGESGNRAVVESDRVGEDFLAAVCPRSQRPCYRYTSGSCLPGLGGREGAGGAGAAEPGGHRGHH